MALTATDITLSKVLYINAHYTIPRNQRRYIWNKEQIEAILDDIFYNMECHEDQKYHHFIGSFIFQKEKSKYKVIDGQQRLTTLTLIFAIVIKILKQYNKEILAENTILFVASKDNEVKNSFNMRLENDDFPIYSMIIHDFCILDNPENDIELFFKNLNKQIRKDEKPFIDNTKLIYEKISEKLLNIQNNKKKGDWLHLLVETLENLSCIKIDATEEQEGCIIFETLNARGVPLEQYELIKNYIFMYSKASSGSDLPAEKWAEIIKLVDDIKHSDIKQFISHYITHRYGKVSATQEYLHIKKHVNPIKTKDLLDDLQLKATIYNKICEPTSSDLSKTSKYVLEFFNSSNIKQLRPVLISVFTAHYYGNISNAELDKFMLKLKNFVSVYFTICQRKANELEAIVYEYSMKLGNDFSIQNLNIFLDNLKSKYPNKEMFIELFCKIGATKHKELYANFNANSKRRVQHILREHEIFLSEVEDCVVASFSIEHIKNDADGGKACYIGNLIPLVKKRNENLKNKTIDEKFSVYEISCFESSKIFSKRHKDKIWNDDAIKDRSYRLANEFYDRIWKM